MSTDFNIFLLTPVPWIWTLAPSWKPSHTDHKVSKWAINISQQYLFICCQPYTYQRSLSRIPRYLKKMPALWRILLATWVTMPINMVLCFLRFSVPHVLSLWKYFRDGTNLPYRDLSRGWIHWQLSGASRSLDKKMKQGNGTGISICKSGVL